MDEQTERAILQTISDKNRLICQLLKENRLLKRALREWGELTLADLQRESRVGGKFSVN